MEVRITLLITIILSDPLKEFVVPISANLGLCVYRGIAYLEGKSFHLGAQQESHSLLGYAIF